MSLKDRMDFALKAFSMSFPRQMGYSTYSLLPRTRYDYGRDVGQGLGNTAVLMCLGWLMRNFPEAPIVLRKKAPDGSFSDVPAADAGPGAMLTLLEYPNDFYDGALLQSALILDYVSTGNAYLVKERNDSDRVIALWWIPKILMRPRWYPNPDLKAGQTGYIDWYEYNPNGVPFRVEVGDVIHFRDGLDPRNGREGLSKMAALAREIFTDDEAANFSATLLANLGVPGVILSPKDTGSASANRLTDPEGVKQQFMLKFGGDKRGEPLVLTSPTDVTTLSFNPQQLALKDLRRIPEERISGITGVAAIVAGLGAGLDHATYANYGDAREASYQEGIIPTHRTFRAVIKMRLLSEFVGDVKPFVLSHDYTEIKALQEDQAKVWERNTKALVSGGITRRTFKLNIGEEPDKTDDVYYLPIALGVINAAEPPPPLESEINPKPQLPEANQLLGPGGQPLAQLVPRNAPAQLAAGQTGPGTAMDAPGSIPATMTGP